MSLFDKIKSLDKEVKYHWMIHIIETCWYYSKDTETLFWADEEDDQTDLSTWSYSADIIEAHKFQDGCWFFNYDNGCGDTLTAILREDKRAAQF